MDFLRMSLNGFLILFLATIIAQVVADSRVEQRVSISQQSFTNVPSGEISSPNFPSPYRPDADSTWTIKGLPEQRVRLQFDAFMLENSTNCDKDYVAIISAIEGEDNKSPRKYCGSQPSFTVTSKSNSMVVTFHSDSQNEYPGFHAIFNLISENDSSAERAGKSAKDKCECGLSDFRRRRVVGGNVSEEQKYPWLAILAIKGTTDRAHCGAVLICRRYLLTAAHCAFMKPDNYYDAILGAYDLTNKASSQIVIGVKKLIPHADYYRPTENNDIALVELEHDVPYNSAIKPICLPPVGLNFTGDKAAVAGWGRTQYNGPLSSVPREAIMPVVDNEECARSFRTANANITDNMMCAGVLDGSIDACQGDSGGPMMWDDPSDQQSKVIGITSFGVKCASVGYYGVYTRVNRYIDWIRSKVNSSDCPCLFPEKN